LQPLQHILVKKIKFKIVISFVDDDFVLNRLTSHRLSVFKMLYTG